MPHYYYSKDGTDVQGPVEVEDIRQMLRAGIISPTTQVCAEGTDIWLEIGNIASLPHPVRQPMTPGVRVTQSLQTSQPQSSPSLLILFGCIVLLAGLASAGYIYWTAKDRADKQFEQVRRADDEHDATMEALIHSTGSDFRRNMREVETTSERASNAWNESTRLGDDFERAKVLSIGLSIGSVIIALLCFAFASRSST